MHKAGKLSAIIVTVPQPQPKHIPGMELKRLVNALQIVIRDSQIIDSEIEWI